MGLIDVLNGMQNGPRGQRDPNARGGMSPITMAILGLLAYKAIKSFGGHQTAPNSASPAAPADNGGGLGDLLKGGLGGLLAGGAAGSILSGGLSDLLKQFQQSGHSDTANSWVGNGPNKSISPNDLANALGRGQDQCADGADRHVARRIAARPQRISAASGRPADAARTRAHRTRSRDVML